MGTIDPPNPLLPEGNPAPDSARPDKTKSQPPITANESETHDKNTAGTKSPSTDDRNGGALP